MSRTAWHKIGFLVVICVITAPTIFLIYSSSNEPLAAIILVALFFIILGRVQGIFYRELFLGRRLFDQHRYEDAIKYFQDFLANVGARSWLKRMIWLSWPIYTPNVVAMTLNNIGAANLELGRFDEAESAFEEAISLDKAYPLPYFNMAVLHEIHGNRVLSEKALAEASRLGYSGGTIDIIINRAGSLLARIEGRGI